MRSVGGVSLVFVMVFSVWPGSGGAGPQVEEQDISAPLTLKQVWSLNATYRDERNGITFRYPAVWRPDTGVGYVPPAVTDWRLKNPVKGFAYEEGGFPRERIVGPYTGTNLDGFGLVYSVLPMANAAECEAKATELGHGVKKGVRIAGRSYSVHQTGGEAMNQSTSGTLYATYAGRGCYLFETDMATVNPAVMDGVHALTPAQLHYVEEHLWKVMQTVRIAR